MAKVYKASPMVNRLTSWSARRGWGRTEVLATRGRKSGEERQLPVSPIRLDGQEYLVAPYGEVAWVRNVRAEPNASLRRGAGGSRSCGKLLGCAASCGIRARPSRATHDPSGAVAPIH